MHLNLIWSSLSWASKRCISAWSWSSSPPSLRCPNWKMYLPSALVEMQLPSGLGDMSIVPRLQQADEEHDAQARLDEYVRAIRATVRVFATYQHKKQTLHRV